ncbi:MAG: pyrroloquinoline quinone precursor peptide PqqA [Bradymonadaceae bacterium]|nr:pyrroloquinoline quinone precursor peptide PqqA [Lujinxingiaceae bacterium]
MKTAPKSKKVWKAPRVEEIAVSMEVSAYQCAEISPSKG